MCYPHSLMNKKSDTLNIDQIRKIIIDNFEWKHSFQHSMKNILFNCIPNGMVIKLVIMMAMFFHESTKQLRT